MRVALVALLVAGSVGAADRRSLWLQAEHTHEQMRLRPFGRLGVPTLAARMRLRRFFRSWRTQERHAVNPRLVRLLARIQRRFGGRRIELVSGYRVPEDRDDVHSYHGVARAADLAIEGVPNRAIFDFCRTLADVGCGLYPTGGRHVHVDARGKSAIWVDLSRYGEGAKYIADPGEWLERHR